MKGKAKTAGEAKGQDVVPATDTEKQLAIFGEVKDTGFENTSSEDYAIPFIKLLQKGSPEVDEDSGAAVEGAKAGMYYDTATGELFETFNAIPCHYHRAMVEWKDRDTGGGFVAQHPVGYETKFPRDDRGRWLTPEGNYIADTRYFFLLRVTDDGDLLPCVVSMTSTQIKKARAWLTRMQTMKGTRPDGTKYQLPIFANMWRFSSVPEQNDQGTWRGYKIELAGPVLDAAVVQQCQAAREMFRSNATNVKPPEENVAANSDDDTPF